MAHLIHFFEENAIPFAPHQLHLDVEVRPTCTQNKQIFPCFKTNSEMPISMCISSLHFFFTACLWLCAQERSHAQNRYERYSIVCIGTTWLCVDIIHFFSALASWDRTTRSSRGSNLWKRAGKSCILSPTPLSRLSTRACVGCLDLIGRHSLTW